MVGSQSTTASRRNSAAEFVDQVVLEQSLDETRAAVNLDLWAVLALERCDVLGDAR